MASEDGWEPLHPTADQLQWVTVPGTSVTLQFLKGQPLAILRAFAADFNAFIEPLRDADSAAYTATNSVATSNHLNGTGMDLNWNSHPFKVLNAGFSAAQIATARELLSFYESTVWWGNDWNSPKDAMHWNMGYNTYGSQNVSRVQDFIARKIRADGFSTFRRGNTAIPSTLSRAEKYALLIIAEGRRRNITPRGIQIALATALVESNITIYANERVPASMGIPHDAVGSDAYSVGIFQQQVRDTGNGWWWGDAATCMDPTSSAGLFYDRLARLNYNGPNSPGSYAQAVQASAYPDRYDERFADAVSLYNQLSTLPAEELDPLEELLMANPAVPSLSIYANPGEPAVPVLTMIAAQDAHGPHEPYVEKLARQGDPDSLFRVARTAAGRGSYGAAAFAVKQASDVLADIEANNPAALTAYLVSKGQA